MQVAAKQMVGVYLSVWARRRLLPHIRSVQVLSVATGALGYFGNKGTERGRPLFLSGYMQFTRKVRGVQVLSVAAGVQGYFGKQRCRGDGV